MKMKLWLFLGGALAAAFALAADAEEEARPQAGDPAPAFRLNDQEGRALSLAAVSKDAWVVLAFFPKAATPGWIREVCSLRDAAKDLDALGVKILAASLDDVATQKKFATDEGLTYPVLSDPDGSVAAKYGVLAAGGRFAARVTFVIDPRGTIRAVDDAVSVGTHGTDLAARIRALQAE